MSPSLEASSPHQVPTLSTEVNVAPRSKRYSAAFKQRLLDEADACVALGALGALLRREGIYFSTLSDFRKQKARRDRDNNRPPDLPKETLAPHGIKELAAAQREVRCLRRELDCATALLELQKKVSELLGLALAPRE